MGYGKRIQLKLILYHIILDLLGKGGIGKTTIVKEMCEKLVGEDGYRFLECGKKMALTVLMESTI